MCAKTVEAINRFLLMLEIGRSEPRIALYDGNTLKAFLKKIFGVSSTQSRKSIKAASGGIWPQRPRGAEKRFAHLEAQLPNLSGEPKEHAEAQLQVLDTLLGQRLCNTGVVGIASIVTQFQEETAGTKVLDHRRFWDVVRPAVENFEFSLYGFGMIPINDAVPFVSLGVAHVGNVPDDGFRTAPWRKEWRSYAKREYAQKSGKLNVLVLTKAAYLMDPEVKANRAEYARFKSKWNHDDYVIIGFSDDAPPVPRTFVRNIAFASSKYQRAGAYTLTKARAEARRIQSYWSRHITVCDPKMGHVIARPVLEEDPDWRFVCNLADGVKVPPGGLWDAAKAAEAEAGVMQIVARQTRPFPEVSYENATKKFYPCKIASIGFLVEYRSGILRHLYQRPITDKGIVAMSWLGMDDMLDKLASHRDAERRHGAENIKATNAETRSQHSKSQVRARAAINRIERELGMEETQF